MGPYKLLGELGKGGMGVVHRAVHPTLGRQVAVKLIRSDLLQGARDYLDRFNREIEIMTRLSHPNIVKVLDGGTEAGQAFLVMELLQARTLKEIADEGTPPIAFALSVLDQIADALDYIHGQGMLHRDIKPENIMVDGSGRAILMDFGLARADGSVSLTGTQDVLGTPRYFAPELVMFAPASSASDLWALGCTAYLLLSGRHAFDAESIHALMGAILRSEPAPLPDRVPKPLAALVARLHRKDPKERLSSAAELRRELDDIATELAAAALPAEPGPPPEPPSANRSGARRRADPRRQPPSPSLTRWLAATLAAVTLALIAALTLLLTRPPPSTLSPAPSSSSPTPTSIHTDVTSLSTFTRTLIPSPLDPIWSPIRAALHTLHRSADLQDLSATVPKSSPAYLPLTRFFSVLDRSALPDTYRRLRPHLPALFTADGTPSALLESLIAALAQLDSVDALATVCGHPPPFAAQAALAPLIEIALDEPARERTVPVFPVLSGSAFEPSTGQAYLVYIPSELPNQLGNELINLSDSHVFRGLEPRDRKPASELWLTPPAGLDRARGLKLHLRVHGLGKQTYARLWPPGCPVWLPLRLPDGQPPRRRQTYWLSASIRGPLARRPGAWRIAQGRAFMADALRAAFAVDEVLAAPIER